MTIDSVLLALRDADVMLPLLYSLLSGAIIGGERELQGKPAGLRTHMLVCFASALMTLLGLRMDEWTVALPVDVQIVSDMARMPHAILTGIGFLCAGVIFREGATVQGLTTAASLWLTAALGIVYGTGLLELAIIGTAITLIVLVALRAVQRWMPVNPELRIELTVRADRTYDGRKLAMDLAREHLRIATMSIEQDRSSDLRRYKLLAIGRNRHVDSERLFQVLENTEGLLGIAITPLENESVA